MTLSVQLVQIPKAERVPNREYYLSRQTIKIGRDYAADICLPDLSKTMSRTHVIISRKDNGEYTVTNTSANGATMNNAPLVAMQPQPLRDGDVISFAGYKLLIGIVETATEDDAPRNVPDQRFEIETDLSANKPLLQNVEIEEFPPEPDKGFSQSYVDLDLDLMFDPFAEGPEMRDDLQPQAKIGRMQDVDIAEAGPLQKMAPHMNQAVIQDTYVRATMYRENVSRAMELALDRFLTELDPNMLQEDYDAYISGFVSRKKRYWDIHRKQFAKKTATGEFRRNFMALFAEEMRKL